MLDESYDILGLNEIDSFNPVDTIDTIKDSSIIEVPNYEEALLNYKRIKKDFRHSLKDFFKTDVVFIGTVSRISYRPSNNHGIDYYDVLILDVVVKPTEEPENTLYFDHLWLSFKTKDVNKFKLLENKKIIATSKVSKYYYEFTYKYGLSQISRLMDINNHYNIWHTIVLFKENIQESYLNMLVKANVITTIEYDIMCNKRYNILKLSEADRKKYNRLVRDLKLDYKFSKIQKNFKKIEIEAYEKGLK